MKTLGVIVAALAVLVACEPEVDPNEPPVTAATARIPHGTGWEVTDVKVTTREQLAYWIVSYDAEWLGNGPPEPDRCVFQTKNQEGRVVHQFGKEIEEGDDVEAAIIYPDEVPGQLRTVTADCD